MSPAKGATFSSLHIRNFRIYVIGQIVSMSGTWMQTVALGWLVLDLSDSGTAVGLVTAAQFVPVLLLGTWAGVIADRFDKRRVIIITQVLLGLVALMLGLLVVTDLVELWMVFLLAGAMGVVTAFDNPTRQTFVLEMVGPEDLTNALTLNSVTINAARVIGPGAAGAVIALVGVGPCFLFNAASFLAVLVAMFNIRVSELHRNPTVPRRKGQLREGFRYVRSVPELRVSLVMMAVIGTLAYEFQVSLPIMAKFTFDGGAATYALMTGAMGVGAVVGGLISAGRPRVGHEVLARTALVFGVTIGAAALAPTLWVALLVLLGTGAASVTFIARANSTIQLASEPAMRGRVMGMWTVCFLGTTPVGGPLVGWIGQTFGGRWALGVGAAAAIGSSLWATAAHRRTSRSATSGAGAFDATAPGLAAQR